MMFESKGILIQTAISLLRTKVLSQTSKIFIHAGIIHYGR